MFESISLDNANLKLEIDRLRTIITNLEIENKEECGKLINLAASEIDSITDLFSRHINIVEKCVFKHAREVLVQKELVEIQSKMNGIEIDG